MDEAVLECEPAVNREDVAKALLDRYDVVGSEVGRDITVEGMVNMVTTVYGEQRMEEIQERIERFEGSQYKSYGKLEEAEDLIDF